MTPPDSGGAIADLVEKYKIGTWVGVRWIFLTSEHPTCLRKRGPGRCQRPHLFRTPFSREDWMGYKPDPERVLACLALHAIINPGYLKKQPKITAHDRQIPIKLSIIKVAYSLDFSKLREVDLTLMGETI